MVRFVGCTRWFKMLMDGEIFIYEGLASLEGVQWGVRKWNRCARE